MAASLGLISACAAGVSGSEDTTDPGGSDIIEERVREEVPDETVEEPVCGSVAFSAERYLPQLYLTIDWSASMFDGYYPRGWEDWSSSRRHEYIPESRHNAVRRIFEPLLRSYRERIAFGLALYQGGDFDTEELIVPRLRNASAIIDALYDKNPDSDTPTLQALRAVFDDFKQRPGRQQHVLLVTDGEPDPATPKTMATIERVVREAYQEHGIVTTVLSMVPNDEEEADHQEHLVRTANLGRGYDADSDEVEPLNPSSPENLAEALEKYIAETAEKIDCTLEIDGTLADFELACNEGVVTLAHEGHEELLGCNQANGNGWRLGGNVEGEEDRNDLITILGGHCDFLKARPDATVTGEFPCPDPEDDEGTVDVVASSGPESPGDGDATGGAL